MVPWFWIWAPQLRFPWSGDVVQDIEPSTSWFFKGIQPGAGNARIEEEAFAVASYGKQLGLLTEVLIGLAESNPDRGAAFAGSLQELKRIQAEIEKLKQAEYDRELLDIESRVAAVQRRGGRRSAALSNTLRRLAADSES
jgi:hypothetical protein